MNAAATRRHPLLGHWLGWRLRLLVAVAFAACLVIFAVMRWSADGSASLAALPWTFWPLAMLALVVILVGAIGALTEPGPASLLYLGFTACQFVSLLLLAAPLAGPIWWWAQLPLLPLAAAAWWMAHLEQRKHPQPVARLVQRALALAAAMLLLLGAAVVSAAVGVQWVLPLARVVPWLWGLLVSALLLAPFLLRSRQALGEFTLLAGISTVAAALDLLFVTLLSLSTFASLTLVVFIALAAYAWARQRLFDRLLERHALTTERIFDQLYRTAREVQVRPERYAQHLAALLRDLFEPMEVQRGTGGLARSRVAASGASLLVPLLPLPDASAGDSIPPRTTTLVLRFARRGQRLFAREDAKLADRVIEQLHRAVVYDLAVEHGRAEERTRIAQDLHDDIGARLLTLMYQAPNAEMEDYVRHTLKDLKTLTRGLAAGQMRWSHALAEWKADLAQRLSAARIELDWNARHDDDPMLGVVQWSALTRVLRELVSNTLHHGHAAHVQVQIHLEQRRLMLSVTDDGVGGDPQAWSHGLGLGGVRKRVKALGGEVSWRQGVPRGIVCEVRVAELAAQSWGG